MTDEEYINFAKAYLPRYSDDWSLEEKKNLLSFMKCINSQGWKEGYGYLLPLFQTTLDKLQELENNSK